MITEWIERVRLAWEKLSGREQRLTGGLAAVAGVLILAFPLYWISSQNTELEEQNTALRAALETLSTRRTELAQLTEARRAAEARFKNKTPPLGSFLEAEAKKHGLTLQEISDEPEKGFGRYLRRSARASIPEVGLTAAINLLSGIVGSPYPVAVDHVQIEHFQAGDKYSFKLGAVTFDKQAIAAEADGAGASDKATEAAE